MESWFRSIFLTFAIFSIVFSHILHAAEEIIEDETGLIDPQIERSEFRESRIDSENFQISAFAGLLGVEDFGTNPIAGFDLTYHVSEEFFIQGVYGLSDTSKTSFEVLSGGAPLLSESERELEYYLVNIGYNFLPGEAFVTDSTAFNTTYYVVGGSGVTQFAGSDHATLNFGFGHRILFVDNFSISTDVRDIIFNLDVFGKNKVTHNLEVSLAISFYF